MDLKLFFLIEDRKLLYLFPQLFALIIAFVSRIEGVSYLFFYLAIFLLLLQNTDKIINQFNSILSDDSPVFLKIGKYILAMFVLVSILFFMIYLTPKILGGKYLFVWNGLLFSAIYLPWSSRIDSYYHLHTEPTVLKSQTNDNRPYFHRTNKMFWAPVFLMMLFSASVAYYQYRIMMSQDISALVHTSILIFGLGLLHLIGNSLVLGEFYWLLDTPHSSVSYGLSYLSSILIPSKFPFASDPKQLTNYFKKIAVFPKPPPGMEDYLKNNLQVLVKYASQTDYFLFVHYFVRAMENWGNKGRDFLFEYSLIVVSSLAKYRMFGRIPIHLRTMFYSYILSIFKFGIAGEHMYKMLEEEALKKNWMAMHNLGIVMKQPYYEQLHGRKDEYHVLNSDRIKTQEFRIWINTWDGKIYIGESGYAKLTTEIERQPRRKIENIWEKEVFEVIIDYVSLFIGKDSKKMFSGDISVQEKILHLSAYQTLENFKDLEIRRKETGEKHKSQFSERMKNQPDTMKTKYSEEELTDLLKQQIAEYSKNSTRSIWDEIHENLKKMRKNNVLKFIAILAVNTLVLYGLIIVNTSLSFGIAIIEVLAIMYIGAYWNEGGGSLESGLYGALPTNESGPDNPEMKGNTAWILYSVMIFVSYIVLRVSLV